MSSGVIGDVALALLYLSKQPVCLREIGHKRHLNNHFTRVNGLRLPKYARLVRTYGHNYCSVRCQEFRCGKESRRS